LAGNRGFFGILSCLEIHPHDAKTASDAVPHGLLPTGSQNALANVGLTAHIQGHKQHHPWLFVKENFPALTKSGKKGTKY
jgi:hypothetical protein